MAGYEFRIDFDLKEIKKDLQRAIAECSERGLFNSTKWAYKGPDSRIRMSVVRKKSMPQSPYPLAEMNFALDNVKLDPSENVLPSSAYLNNEADKFMLAKSYFDLKEFDSRFPTIQESGGLPILLKTAEHLELDFYTSTLVIYQPRRSELRILIDSTTPVDPSLTKAMRDLGMELRRDYKLRKLDGYGFYLYGIVMKKLNLQQEALVVMVEAVHKEPMHWGAWLELATLITDREKLLDFPMPEHWMRHFFVAHVYLDLQLNDEALEIYLSLQANGFDKSNHVSSQIAVGFHNRREVDLAISTFRKVLERDPYRLDNVDTYSNLLYVHDLRVDLAHMAHKATEIDKFRVETCCVVGNYYSLRNEHQKAALYFQRALKLNPLYLSAWTLMGHEYMEMKNTNAAIQSYRQAIEVNRRDYRAWYGLGQTYEILKMLFYCLYYYKQAQRLRPNDSRMLIALGETYEKLEKFNDAIKCYFKAFSVGDSEVTSTLKLAKLYDKIGEASNAKKAYEKYVEECLKNPNADKSELSQAYKYLANAYLKIEELDDAYQYAQKCLEYEEVKEEAKALLRTIAQKRSQQEEAKMQVQ
uniref:Cdc23 domain-containing protein n=1 Tax=Timema genevievae TaxID=629358 RepID=A0A7R9PRC9_TIMGE|nr:unnamed protein product [Timema genevievae]